MPKENIFWGGVPLLNLRAFQFVRVWRGTVGRQWWTRGKLSWPRATFDAPQLVVGMKINIFEENTTKVPLETLPRMSLGKVRTFLLWPWRKKRNGKNVFIPLTGWGQKCFDGIGLLDHNVRPVCSSATRAKSLQPPSPAFTTILPFSEI